MKGLIFTEFLEMVEDRYGYEVVDKIILKTKSDSNGAYSSVGTYPHSEIVSLVSHLSEEIGIPVSDLLRVFGKHAFKRFADLYPSMFHNIDDTFSFLMELEDNIHVQVLKLYPDAELPTFRVESCSENDLIMIYISSRKMADLAEGLMFGCLEHFKQAGTIQKENLKEDESRVRFILKLN